jgi:hypothetical protein
VIDVQYDHLHTLFTCYFLLKGKMFKAIPLDLPIILALLPKHYYVCSVSIFRWRGCEEISTFLSPT